MCRTVSAHSGRIARLSTALAVLLGLAVAPAHAQQGGVACKLLQVAEIESALGDKASKGLAGFRQAVPGMDVDQCSVETSGPGRSRIRTATVRVVGDLPSDARELLSTVSMGRARETQWKVPGARLEQKTVGNAVCEVYGRPNVAGHSTCSIPRGKRYVEVDVTASLSDLVSMEVVAALAQKAAARL